MKGVERIVLDNPPANSLDIPHLRRILKRLKEIERRSDSRAVIISSSRTAVFSSGLDLKAMLCPGRWSTACRIIQAEILVYRIVRTIRNSQMVFIAQLNGGVIGSAVSIAMACDFRLGNQDVWFWMPDPRYGGLPADGVLDLLSAAAGPGTARRLCLAMERIGAEEALACGCLHRIVDRDALKDTARYFASEIAVRAPLSLRYTKRILNSSVRIRFPFWKLLHIVVSREMYRRLREACRQPAA